MTKSILDSIGMNETHIFYDHFHLKENLKKALLCKQKFLKPTIGVMFRASSHEMLEISCKKATSDCSGNTNCVSTLVKLIDLKNFQISLIIDSVKGIFGKCGSSWSEFNYSSVNNFVSQCLEGIHGAMQQLMIRQHKLIFQNNEFIFKQYLDIKVIEQSHALETNYQDIFLYEASIISCDKGCMFIKKYCGNASMIFYKVLDDQSIICLYV